jgi:hypothetical protein
VRVLAVEALLEAINPVKNLVDLGGGGIFGYIHGLPVETTLISDTATVWELGKVDSVG